MSRCLVIGGNGFLGATLADALSAAGHVVTVFDRFSGGIVRSKRATIRLRRGDFLNGSDLREAVVGQEIVFHMLSTTNPAISDREPMFDIRTNVSQTVELLQYCVKAGVRRFVFASSGGAIYGRQDKTAFSETDIAAPISPYAIGKLSVERYLEYFHIRNELETVALRISNPYGPAQSADRMQGLIAIALHRARSGKTIQRMGNGAMVRDYIYIDDLIARILLLAESSSHSIYNIGSGVGASVNEILNVVADVTGVELLIEEVDRPATYVDRVVLETSRFDNEFGNLGLTSIADGIRATWAGISR